MDESLVKAEKYLEEKYSEPDCILGDVEQGYIIELFEVIDNGKKVLKLLYHFNKKETTVYHLTPEQIIE